MKLKFVFVCSALLLALFYPVSLKACSHNGTTRKCVACLRENYMSYGKEKAAIRCDNNTCPYGKNTLENHKHCGRHGSVVTPRMECAECAREEAKQHWREAELSKTESQAFKKLGIPVPTYRDKSSVSKRTSALRMLRGKIADLNNRIEGYEEKMFQPGMSGVALRRLEKKIEELEFARDVYYRAIELWEGVEE